MGSVLSELLKLLADTEIVESKLRVASTLETVLESAGLQVYNWPVSQHCEPCSVSFTGHSVHRRYRIRTPTSLYVVSTGVSFMSPRSCTGSLGTATGDNFMVKNALLRIVAQLISVSQHNISPVSIAYCRIQAVKENSAPLASIVVPLIQESFTPNVSPFSLLV